MSDPCSRLLKLLNCNLKLKKSPGLESHALEKSDQDK